MGSQLDSSDGPGQHFDGSDTIMGAGTPRVLHQQSAQGAMFGNGMAHTMSPGLQGYPQQAIHYSGGHSQFSGMGVSDANMNYGGGYSGGNGPFTPTPSTVRKQGYPESFGMGSRRRTRMHDEFENDERLDSLENLSRAGHEEITLLKTKVDDQAAAIAKLEEQFKALSSGDQEGNSKAKEVGEKLDTRIGVSIKFCSRYWIYTGLTSGQTGLCKAFDERSLRDQS